jgi:hypothetical protein
MSLSEPLSFIAMLLFIFAAGQILGGDSRWAFGLATALILAAGLLHVLARWGAQ